MSVLVHLQRENTLNMQHQFLPLVWKLGSYTVVHAWTFTASSTTVWNQAVPSLGDGDMLKRREQQHPGVAFGPATGMLPFGQFDMQQVSHREQWGDFSTITVVAIY